MNILSYCWRSKSQRRITGAWRRCVAGRRKPRPVIVDICILGPCRHEGDFDKPLSGERTRPSSDAGHLKCSGMMEHRKDSGKVYAISVCG
jgi:hypothetical protein